ncbi:MAG TPA: glycosyltransferase family 4 protein [Gemmatimonadaceae bacterium]|nr:glycosyltransferase family 4 protein [Gemmatimonadaceae bacterium]
MTATETTLGQQPFSTAMKTADQTAERTAGRSLRILVLATDAYGGTGGIAQYMRDLIAAVASHPRTEAVTVIPRIVSRDTEPLPQRVTHLARSAGNKFRFIAATLRASVARPGFDFIICGHVNLLPAATAAAAISGAKVILVVYGMEAWEPKGRIARLLLSRVFAVISISSVTIDRLRAWSRLAQHRTFLLPNAIDLSRYTPGAKNEQLMARWSLGGRQILLTVGRMDAAEQAKGFDEILDVLPELVAEIPGLAYVAVGDGSDRMRLQAKAASLGMKDNCVFPGYVSESEKLEYYRLADVFVMPSRLEGFGYVFLEALAAGVPVIASKVDGSREAVRNGEWGALVDPARPQELIEAIRRALSKPHIPSRRELDVFSCDSFVRRCHAMLDALQAGEVGR